MIGCTDIEPVGNEIFDIEDVILMDLGLLIAKAKSVFGTRRSVLDQDTGIRIEAPEEDPTVSFGDRLALIIEEARLVVASVPDANYGVIASRMFALDGWTWNEHVFRSPIWMNDYRELPINEAREIEGMEWITTGSSSEIQFVQ